MTRPLGSWLSGSDPSGESGANEYPGQRLGLPPSGPGSIAGFGRRIAALLIDWFIAYGLVGLALSFGLLDESNPLWVAVGGRGTGIAVVWVVLGIVSVRLFGFTPGQLALGVRVASIDNRLHVGLGRATVRGILVFFVIPALFTDSDLRGYQDRFTGTAVVRR
ncbi:RDD family protein [Mycolicibacterium gadium]|uniref:RDD family protein n=1 Tax=Mycolicibacterium gadium TaxID=1794 RepID=A0ABT6GKY2_MYCGU|nr:RDD family protein [Mycolicibacterium gadium]MDG5482047.1 RDD family protein [Mycolicibacterium gadium]